jgi:hypothetical protein
VVSKPADAAPGSGRTKDERKLIELQEAIKIGAQKRAIRDLRIVGEWSALEKELP